MSRAAHRILRADPVMAALITAAGPFRLDSGSQLGAHQERSPFETLARAIAHQQLNGTAAQSILARLQTLFDACFPTPEQLLQADPQRLRGAGFSFAKIAALQDLAAKTLAGVVPGADELSVLADDEIIERLTAVRGIGRWTVEMLLIFRLQRPDVLPVDDFGVRNGFRLAYGLQGLPLPRALAEFGERWRPHRSMAAWYLWRAVELERRGALPRCARPPRIAVRSLARKVAPAAQRARRKLAAAKRARPATRRTGSAAAAAGQSGAARAGRAAGPRGARGGAAS